MMLVGESAGASGGQGRMSAVRAAKAALRRQVLADRAGLPALQRGADSAAICARLACLPELQGARAVLAYAAFGSEVDVDALLRVLLAREHGIFLPWVEGPSLRIGRIADLDADLVPGWRGVREPRSARPARPDRIDAAIVPGVAFDAGGARLGYGGGHFDRLLADLRSDTPVIGVAYDVQVVARVPLEDHDRRADVVITPTRTLRRPARPPEDNV